MVLRTKYYLGTEMKENKMSGARCTYGEGKCINLLTGNLNEGNNFERIVVVERIIFKWIIKNKWMGLDWLEHNQDMDKWRYVETMAVNVQFC